MTRAVALPLLLAAAAGAGGTTCQLLWARLLGAALGHGAMVVPTVLATTLFGLGLGGALAGRLLDRGVPARRLFALAWWVQAAHTLALLLGADLLLDGLAALLPAELGGVAAAMAAAAATAVLLAPAALAVGVTVPALAAVRLRGRLDGGEGLAAVYGVEMVGAAGGALLAVLVLLPALGVRGALAAAALLGVALALAARALPGAPLAEATPDDTPAAAPGRAVRAAAFALGLTGIGLQTVWTRALAVRLAGTVYSYAVILAAYLLAAGLGAMLASALARRGRLRPQLVAAAVAVVPAAGALALPVLAWLEPPPGEPVASFGAAVGGEMLRALAAMLLPSLAVGAAFPLLVRAAQREARTFGRDLAGVYAANAIGAVVAPLLTALALMPWLGLAGATAALALPPLLAALALAAWSGRALARAGVTAAVVAAACAGVDVRRWRHAEGDQLVAYREGALATTAVVRHADGDLALFVDWSYRLGSTAGRFHQQRQGVLPLLLHQAPRRALFFGVGTGSTVGAAVELGGVEIDAVELVPEVLELLPHFADVNFGLASRLADGTGRVRALPVDGRRFVRATDRRYDVVVADLFMPWLAAEAGLYAREHFAALRRVLAEGGIACQWLPLYQLDAPALASVVRTFLDVFPHASAWWLVHNPEQPVLGLIGAARPLRLHPAALAEQVQRPARQALLEDLALATPAAVAAFCALDAVQLGRLAADGTVERALRPRQEFTAPRAALVPRRERARAMLAAVLALAGDDAPAEIAELGPPAALRRRAGHALLAGLAALRLDGDRAAALRHLERAAQLAPDWHLVAWNLQQARLGR